jgi:hypothetical protein
VRTLSAAAAAAGAAASMMMTRGGKRVNRGSVLYRAANIPSIRMEAARRLDADYFCRDSSGTPHYDVALANEYRFERAFRMPRIVFENMRSDILLHNKAHIDKSVSCNLSEDECPCFNFEERSDAAGVRSCTTDQKLCAGLF